MSLWQALDEAFRRHADRPVYSRGAALCYAELRERVLAQAAALHERGVAPGERVAARLPNGRAYFELYLACAALGAVLVPLNLRLTAREVGLILRDSGARLVVYEGDEAADVAALRGAVEGLDELEVEVLEAARPARFQAFAARPEAVAQLYYTSGTTGRPKGVPLSHANVLSHARAAELELGLSAEDTWGHIAPMFHLADAWAVFAATLAGARHAFTPRFSARAAWSLFTEEGVTLTNLVPTMLGALVDTAEGREAPPTLRLVLSGGAPIAPELVRRVERAMGCAYAQTYGLTETSPYLTISLPDERAADLTPAEREAYVARTGRPFGGVELRVVDKAGAPVPADDATVGEIQARGPWVFGGYWERPEETEAAFDGDWFRTGDLATLDGRGSLRIVDRKKDVILSGGETIYSTEVENALYTHQLVAEAAVFGLPDERWGEVVTAVVVRRSGADGRRLEAAELLGHLRLFLAGFKLPRRVRFLSELPRSGSGKIQKRLLRERCLDLELPAFDHVHPGDLP